MTNKTKQFNFWFNIFILVGMVTAVTVVSLMQIKTPEARLLMQVIAGLGAIMGVINTVLSANANVWTFLFGFIDVICCSIVYFDSGIMGTCALHVFYFLPMQFIGFWQWTKRGAETKSHVNEEGEREIRKVRVRRLSGKQWGLVVAAFIVGTAVAYSILYFIDLGQLRAGHISEISQSKIFLDAAVLILNIIGQILLSFAFADQWFIWNFVNIFSILLWTNRLLSPDAIGYTIVMAIKYVFYLMNSINGLRIWLALAKEHSAPEETGHGCC